MTPVEEEWLSSVAGSDRHLFLARFRALPDSRPSVHVRNRALEIPRVALSAQYIDELISKYLLAREYQNTFEAVMPGAHREFVCVFNCRDITSDVPMVIGYGSNGKRLTLIPDVQFWQSSAYSGLRGAFKRHWVPWGDRKPVAFWRGSSTGAAALTTCSFAKLPRYRLCLAGSDGGELQGRLDAKLTRIVQAKSADDAEQIRDLANSRNLMAAPVPQADFLKYRFLIDIDGNVNAWGLFPKLLMGSCVLKVLSDWQQWYYDRLVPWVHYVPIKNDRSDLLQQVEWCLEHDDDAREIAERGTEFANKIVIETELPRAGAAILEASHSGVGGPEHTKGTFQV